MTGCPHCKKICILTRFALTGNERMPSCLRLANLPTELHHPCLSPKPGCPGRLVFPFRFTFLFLFLPIPSFLHLSYDFALPRLTMISQWMSEVVTAQIGLAAVWLSVKWRVDLSAALSVCTRRSFRIRPRTPRTRCKRDGDRTRRQRRAL